MGRFPLIPAVAALLAYTGGGCCWHHAPVAAVCGAAGSHQGYVPETGGRPDSHEHHQHDHRDGCCGDRCPLILPEREDSGPSAPAFDTMWPGARQEDTAAPSAPVAGYRDAAVAAAGHPQPLYRLHRALLL